MQAVATELPGVLILEPKVFGDERGFFFESHNRRAFREATGVDVEFVQDNHSRSKKDVLRGLHYQLRQAQGKLVRVIAGEVWDVAVDLRKGSATFGNWAGFTLSADAKRMAWIPPGFAHGFLVDQLRPVAHLSAGRFPEHLDLSAGPADQPLPCLRQRCGDQCPLAPGRRQDRLAPDADRVPRCGV
jgi:dTDP-4-dehydrorhamnose 3,5-epimerase